MFVYEWWKGGSPVPESSRGSTHSLYGIHPPSLMSSNLHKLGFPMNWFWWKICILRKAVKALARILTSCPVVVWGCDRWTGGARTLSPGRIRAIDFYYERGEPTSCVVWLIVLATMGGYESSSLYGPQSFPWCVWPWMKLRKTHTHLRLGVGVLTIQKAILVEFCSLYLDLPTALFTSSSIIIENNHFFFGLNLSNYLLYWFLAQRE